MTKFKKGQKYLCINSKNTWWTVGKIYEVDCSKHDYVLRDNDDTPWHDFDIVNFDERFIVKEDFSEQETNQIAIKNSSNISVNLTSDEIVVILECMADYLLNRGYENCPVEMNQATVKLLNGIHKNREDAE